MMRRVKKIVFAGLLALLWIVPTQVMAVPIWYVATVTSVGIISNGRLSLLMSDQAATPVFTKRWFIVQPNSPIKKELLAVALTATAMKSQVFVFVDGEVSFSKVIHLYACSDTC